MVLRLAASCKQKTGVTRALERDTGRGLASHHHATSEDGIR